MKTVAGLGKRRERIENKNSVNHQPENVSCSSNDQFVETREPYSAGILEAV